jgi:hypothetical protein
MNSTLQGRKMAVTTLDDLKKVLTEYGYSKKAIEEIVKWYE